MQVFTHVIALTYNFLNWFLYVRAEQQANIILIIALSLIIVLNTNII